MPRYLALLIALLPAAAPAMAVDFEGEIVLGIHSTAEATIHLEPGQEAAGLRLEASVGRFVELEVVDGGGLRATYLPPGTRFPQQVLAMLWRPRPEGPEVLGTFRFELFGTTRIPVKTAPRSVVRIHVGERVFGPATVGASGSARIGIVAPPGALEARIAAVDPGGVYTERRVALEAPPDQLLVAVAGPERIAPGSEVVVEVRGAEGALVFEAPGTFAVEARGPGAWRVRWRPSGTGEVGATVGLGEARARVSTQVLSPVAVASLIPQSARAPVLPSRAPFLGLHLGLVHSLIDERGLRVGVSAGVHLPLAGRTWRLEALLSGGHASQIIPDPGGGRATALFLPVALRLSGELARSGAFSARAGAGALAAWAHFQDDLSASARNALGVGGAAFLEGALDLSPGEIFVEASLSSLPVRAPDFHLEAGGASLTAGGRLAF